MRFPATRMDPRRQAIPPFRVAPIQKNIAYRSGVGLDWYPADRYEQILVGAVDKYEFHDGAGTEADWNIYIRPNPPYAALIDDVLANADVETYTPPPRDRACTPRRRRPIPTKASTSIRTSTLTATLIESVSRSVFTDRGSWRKRTGGDPRSIRPRLGSAATNRGRDEYIVREVRGEANG